MYTEVLDTMQSLLMAGYVVEVVSFLASQEVHKLMGFVSKTMLATAFRETGIGRGSAKLRDLMEMTGVIVVANNGDCYIDVEVAKELVKALLDGGSLPTFDRRTKPTRLRQLCDRARRRRESSPQADALEVGQTTTTLPKERFSPEELAALRVLRSLARRYEQGFRVSLEADPSDLDQRAFCLAFVPAAYQPHCAAGIEALIDHGVLRRVGPCGERRVVYDLCCNPMTIDVGPEFLSPPPRPRPVHKRHTPRPSMRDGRSPAVRRVRLAAASS